MLQQSMNKWRAVTSFLIIFAVILFSIIFSNKYLLSFILFVENIKIHNQYSDFRKAKEKFPRQKDEVSLAAVGDISFSRGVERMLKKVGDFNYPFLQVKDYFLKSDLVWGNLETTITEGREILDGEMVFRSNPGMEKVLRQANFSVVSLANNHTPDFGQQGLEDTINYLKNARIEYTGSGRNELEANLPKFVEKKGIKFAFLSFNDSDVVPKSYGASDTHAGTAFMNIEKMVKAVEETKTNADFTIVSMHSGTEYIPTPNQSQINFAHAAIDAGADIVIGSHPHVVQTMEKYEGKYIFYSLGNFVFDQMWSRETREGLMIKIFFDKEGVTKIDILPTLIENYSQPKILFGETADKVLASLQYPLTEKPIFYFDKNKNSYTEISRKSITNNTNYPPANISKSETLDINNNYFKEEYILEKGQLKIVENQKVIWLSPADWWVDDFILADSTNDNKIDINLSVWKSGNFGSGKPFWVKENDKAVKNHFFVFNLEGDSIKPVWQSSNLTSPNCEIAIGDVDQDERNELVVIEGEYTDNFTCQGKYVAVWRWNDWGFKNEWRSEQGEFNDLMIEKMNGKSYIIID